MTHSAAFHALFVQVLKLFSENFDYQHRRKDLLLGVLGSGEMFNHTVFSHIVQGEYAARVKDLRTYGSVRFVKPVSFASACKPLGTACKRVSSIFFVRFCRFSWVLVIPLSPKTKKIVRGEWSYCWFHSGD